jgi:hypothetical protein
MKFEALPMGSPAGQQERLCRFDPFMDVLLGPLMRGGKVYGLQGLIVLRTAA